MGYLSYNSKANQFSYKSDRNGELILSHLAIFLQNWNWGLHEVH
jgi:hypothetical protein